MSSGRRKEIVEHCPVETWHSGKHILSLYYPIEKIVANYTNTFNVYLWMENGRGTIDVGDCIASVSGQAMAAGEAWDGKLEVEDYTTRFAIGGGLNVNGFRESLSMQMKETGNRGFEVYFAESGNQWFLQAGRNGGCVMKLKGEMVIELTDTNTGAVETVQETNMITEAVNNILG